VSTFSPLQREAFSRRQPEQIDFSRTSRYRLQPVAVDLSARELGVLIGAVCPRLGAPARRVNGCSGVGVVGWASKRSF